MFFWILSAGLLSYAAYLAGRLAWELRALRSRSRQETGRLERRLELVEQASWKSRYGLPSFAEPQEGETDRIVTDLDRHRHV